MSSTKFETRDATLKETQTRCNSTGTITEMKFCAKIEKMGMSAHPAFCDVGIDCVVLGDNLASSPAVHRVQVAAGSSKAKRGSPNSYNVTKPCKKILNNIDIIAVLIEHDFKNTTNPNTGTTGLQELWYIIPYEVYTDKRMHKDYHIHTNSSWAVNPTVPNKVPLDHAFEEWNLFRKSSKMLRSKKLVEGFFC